MQPFPFFGFPNYRIPNHQNHENKSCYDLHNQSFKPSNFCKTPYFPSDFEQKNCKNSSSTKKEQEKFSCSSNCESTEDFFEIFGLKLSIDDLLILALLFFLYKENVDDSYLFIALILLLLT